MVILPNGPLALSAILSVAAVAVALPVGIEEPTQALSAVVQQSNAAAILFDRRHAAKAEALCAKHDLVALAIGSTTDSAPGKFSLDVVNRRLLPADPSRPDDAAMLARTAGTGKEARVVAWSQLSLYRSAAVFADWAELNAGDRSLCLMPFAHMHSMVRSCLPVLIHGGAIVCAPGFDRTHVLGWLHRCRPTFMTAVPSIYRAMVDAVTVSSRLDGHSGSSLRFLAVGSDRMDQATVANLETAFRVPVREFYGMSEVSPMLAATPTGMSAQQDGAVGEVMSAWQLVIRSDDGRDLPSDVEGEVCALGGFLNHVLGDGTVERTDSDGWYRTGDLGFFDPAGRLHVTGRIDDRIVRGGKKIVPAAVEAVLAEHPDVNRSVVFPVPDEGLGQVVGAAVVARRGFSPSVAELRAYLADRLPDYMVPQHLVLVDDLPKTLSGKVSRRSLAAALGLPPSVAEAASAIQQRFEPCSDTERQIMQMVSELLERDRIDLCSSFTELGGDSFLATSLLVAIEERFAVMPEPGEFLANDSVERLARLVDRIRVEADIDLIVKLQEGTEPVPLFIAHGPGGNAIYASSMATALGKRQSVYAFRFHGERDGGVLSMAAHAKPFARAMQLIQPTGPFCLAGHSFGAQLALEVAQQLTEAGRDVAFLGVIDDEADLFKRKFGVSRRTGPPHDTYDYFRQMLDGYVTKPYAGDIALFLASPPPVESLADPTVGWGELALGHVTRLDTAGDHHGMMSAANIEQWIGDFKDQMAAALARYNTKAGTLRGRLDARADLLCRPDVVATQEARTAARRGELQAEIAAYRRAIHSGHDQPYWVYRNLGLALEQSGRIDEALDCLALAADKEARPVIGKSILARKMFQRGRRLAALRHLKQAESVALDNAPALAVCGNAWRAFGFAKRAMRCYRQSLRRQPDNPAVEIALAGTLLSLRRFKEAEQMITASLAKYPDRVDFQRMLATLQRTVGDTEAAASTLRRALQRDPRKPILYHEFSKVLDAQGNLEEAVEFAQQATERLPGNAYFHLWYGKLLEKQGDDDAAAVALRRARELDPGLFVVQRRGFQRLRVIGQRWRSKLWKA
jgi:acyl-CoA synthetase (AMP-forming)/AMP-acid ligase II/tetratricopeptide (TPR) repeat protein/acyl carrier protein